MEETNESNNKEAKYNIYEIIYTDLQGKRSKALVAESTSQGALSLLEESLINFGYTPKNIEDMIPLSKITEFKSPGTWIEFRPSI